MPSVATAPPAGATVRKSRLVLSNVSVIASSVVNRSIADIHSSLAARTRSGKAMRYPVRGSEPYPICHCTEPSHPEEPPKGASRRVGNNGSVAHLRDAPLRGAPQGEVER